MKMISSSVLTGREDEVGMLEGN